MCGKMQASGLTGFNPSIRSSAIWGNPVSLFTLSSSRQLLPAFPQLFSHTMEGGSIPRIKDLGALIHIWRPEITDGCDISCLLMWQEIFSFHKLVGKTQSWTFLYVLPWDVTSPVFNLSLGTNLGVDFKAGICWWERMDTAFLILLKCSWIS